MRSLVVRQRCGTLFTSRAPSPYGQASEDHMLEVGVARGIRKENRGLEVFHPTLAPAQQSEEEQGSLVTDIPTMVTYIRRKPTTVSHSVPTRIWACAVELPPLSLAMGTPHTPKSPEETE